MFLILYHSFFLSHEWKETEKMHFSVLFAIQESFKFPFFCALSLSHVISSCTWHSLQHVWQFHFQTGSTSKRKELPIQFENHHEKSHFWSKLSFIPMRHFQGFLNTVYVSTPLFTETETPADAFINGKMHLVASRAEKNKKPLLIFRWEKIKLDQNLIIA